MKSDLGTITAYNPEPTGVFQYIFVYKDDRGEDIAENFMKAFIGTISVRLDEDRDGIYTDEEEALGTDPKLIDTDGDGFSDKEEVDNGYNPLGEGRLGS